MRFRPTRRPTARASRSCAGFTLAEVLAALLFMAIVIPVAMEGVRVASLAGEVGPRKAVAARIAGNVLNELLALGQWQKTSQTGTVVEGTQEYRWTMQLDTWNLGALTPLVTTSQNPVTLQLLTVKVTFPVQGRDYEVGLSTLVDTQTQ